MNTSTIDGELQPSTLVQELSMIAERLTHVEHTVGVHGKKRLSRPTDQDVSSTDPAIVEYHCDGISYDDTIWSS